MGRVGWIAIWAAKASRLRAVRNQASMSSTDVRMPRCNKARVSIRLGASRRGWGVTKFTQHQHVGQRHTTRQPAHHMPQAPIDIAASRICSRPASFLVSAAYAQGSPRSGLARVKPEDRYPEKRGLTRAAPVGRKLRQLHEGRAKVMA